eukprot:s768_g3.t1
MGLEIAHRFPHSTLGSRYGLPGIGPCSLERPFSRPEEWSWRCCWLLQAVLLGFVVAEDNGAWRDDRGGEDAFQDQKRSCLQVKVAPQLHQALAGIKNIHVLGLLGTQ